MQSPDVEPAARILKHAEGRDSLRRVLGIAYFAVVTAAFSPILVALGRHVAKSELHSYILCIPFVSAYLIYIEWNQLPRKHTSSPKLALLAGSVGLVAWAADWTLNIQNRVSWNDYLGLAVFSFLCLLVSGGFFFLGQKWMSAAAFPVAFLFFLIPMPDAMVETLESGSKLASAEAANLFLIATNTPFLRQGTIFLLPDITIQVAQECSGIRSSWILFITSLLGAHLFLRTPWRRAALVAFVIPLGILRNGFRILVIGLLCIHVGPGMIDSWIHHQGGPIFFALSLGPLLLFLWWLRRGETSRPNRDQEEKARPAAVGQEKA